jgi:hypothetical protein
LAASFSSSEEFDEQAYRRSDALEKRRKLMEAWAAYCEPWASANVVQIRKQKPL